MRKLVVAMVAVFMSFSVGALAGVAPNGGGQSTSGAKIKPANHNPDAEKSEQTPEKDGQHSGKEDKR